MDEIKVLNYDRRIIYVDASFNNETSEAKISLYDKEISKLDTLLISNASNSGEAERYAILYACLYVKKKNITDRKIHILNDNYNATKNEKILNICKYVGANLSWIPREINEIADKGSKLDVNIKEEESSTLEFFYDIMIKNLVLTVDKQVEKKIDKPVLNKTKKILKNAIKQLKVKNKPYVPIGEVGKYLKTNNPSFKYSQLKNELLKYKDDFVIVKENYVKIK